MHFPHGATGPSASYAEALNRASDLFGIQSSFYDIWGKHHVTPNQVTQSILRSLGVDIASADSIDHAILSRLIEATALLPATLVLLTSDPSFPVTVPASYESSTLQASLRLENGETVPLSFSLANLAPEAEWTFQSTSFKRYQLSLPKDLPLGYHSLHLETAGLTATAHLILAPNRAFWPTGDHRYAGIAISLYGLRSERNWGCGDFTDLIGFTDWMAARTSAAFIGLNPLHAIANRTPYNTSPYLPQCSFYRNFLYLDVERIADLQASPIAQKLLTSPTFQTNLAALRDAEYVNYESVSRTKIRFLKLLFRTFMKELKAHTPRAQSFEAFTAREGEMLHRYATYCALDEYFHKRDRNVWICADWPELYQSPNTDAVKDFAARHWRTVTFFKYVQWQVDAQLAEAQQHTKDRGLKIGLYHDLALATDRYGADLWAFPEFYISGCRVGSPPDDFSPKGQDWSFPPPNAETHRRNGYQLFRLAIANNARHGGALRMDHVMRFFRIYWIPDGNPATEGTYVRDNAEDLLRILALESIRNEFILVGEDLGTVEPHVREALERYGILSYRLLYFEKNEGNFRHPHEYPVQALVSSTTHDLPTLAGFWTNRDIESRRAAGLIDEHGYQLQLASRILEKQKMLDAFHQLGLLPSDYPRDAALLPEFTGELHNAAVGFLASTPSVMLLLNQEDLTKETEQQNLPGSTGEYPNWRRKMRYTIEQLATNKDVAGFSEMFQHWLAKTGRTG